MRGRGAGKHCAQLICGLVQRWIAGHAARALCVDTVLALSLAGRTALLTAGSCQRRLLTQITTF